MTSWRLAGETLFGLLDEAGRQVVQITLIRELKCYYESISGAKLDSTPREDAKQSESSLFH